MLSHSQLVSIAVRFLKKSKYKYIQTESALQHESPDALGLKSNETLLIECKATRADFLADKKKSFRLNPETGVGSKRMYLTNPGIIKPEELPQKWELYEALSENTIIRVFPTDDIISFFGEWDTCRFSDRNFRAEYHFLYNCVNSEYRSHVLDNYEVGRLKIESVPNEEKWKHKEIRHRFELQGRCGFCKHRNNPCEQCNEQIEGVNFYGAPITGTYRTGIAIGSIKEPCGNGCDSYSFDWEIIKEL